MKLMLGNTPVKKMMIHNDTQDATVVPSDLQAGVTCYAKGQKVTGTGKSFEFANYGRLRTNFDYYIPTGINVIEVASVDHPVKLNIALTSMKDVDFSSSQNVAIINIDGVDLNITARANSNILRISCDNTIYLQVFYGKDNYV